MIQALRVGVRDFVSKSVEYLDYLPEAVGRVLSQVVTERKLAESEALLAGVIGSAKDAVIVVEADRTVSLFNPAAERMFGCRAGAALGRRLTDFIPDELAAAHGDGSLTNRLRAGARGVRACGAEFPLEATVSPGRVGERKFYTVVVRDVTERERLEERLRQSQKMEALGQLAGGVAHDFNNILTVITGCTDLVRAALPVDDPNCGLVEEIYRAGERAARLTRQLLTFSRQETADPQVLDLNTIVEGACKMLRRLIGEHVRLATVPEPELGAVRADAGQIEQVLVNLAVNARDAMPAGGGLTVATANVELSDAHACIRPGAVPGRYVLLAVSDTGCGMTEEVRGRAFEPFFTTKGPGRGTGLGLATVLAIARQWGGHVDISSAIGRGTTVEVYLPSVGRVAACPPEARPRGQPDGNGTVLVVEDDEPVRQLVRAVLTALGYRVLEAAGGEEALLVHAAHGRPVDLVLTDVVMPGMSGWEVAEALKRVQPGVPVLFMSGHTDDSVTGHIALRMGVFVPKPFTASTLGEKVRMALGRE